MTWLYILEKNPWKIMVFEMQHSLIYLSTIQKILKINWTITTYWVQWQVLAYMKESGSLQLAGRANKKICLASHNK